MSSEEHTMSLQVALITLATSGAMCLIFRWRAGWFQSRTFSQMVNMQPPTEFRPPTRSLVAFRLLFAFAAGAGLAYGTGWQGIACAVLGALVVSLGALHGGKRPVFTGPFDELVPNGMYSSTASNVREMLRDLGMRGAPNVTVVAPSYLRANKQLEDYQERLTWEDHQERLTLGSNERRP